MPAATPGDRSCGQANSPFSETSLPVKWYYDNNQYWTVRYIHSFWEETFTKAAVAEISPYIPFERASAVPLYKQVYEGYRAAILSGRLRPGQRLPSTRALSAELKISRMPVLNAFEQLLHEGYIEGRVGSGTYVKDTIPDDLTTPQVTRQPMIRQPRRAKPSGTVDAALLRDIARYEGGLGPFRVSVPALDHFPRKTWARLLWRHTRNFPVELMAYGDPAGYLPLRDAIAQYMRAARAVRCEASQVLIVSGSQMALQICAMALLSPGDAVCVEEPGYPGAVNALRTSGAAVVPVAVDDAGVVVNDLVSQGKKVRVAYVTPSHQYPLGTSMTVSRRLELLGWAQRNQSLIIEDDYDSEYRYASRPLGALQGMDTATRVIYIGTFSKVLFPSLRLGYVIVPPTLFSTFRRVREALDIFSPTLYQMVLTDFLREGHFARHVRRMRTIYLGRRNALVESLQARIGDMVTIHNADAGLHLSAFLPRSLDDREVVRRAAQRQIAATALSTCYVGAPSRSGLILGFGGSPERRLRHAVKTLSRVIRDLA